MKDINIKADEYITKNDRVKLLKEMHDTMISMNNEDAYTVWTYTMPDQPSIDDFYDIANDMEMFKECVEAFNRIFNRYKKDGLYDIEQNTINLMKRYHVTIEVIF